MSRINLVRAIPDDTPRPVMGQQASDGTHRMLLTDCTYACRLHHPKASSRLTQFLGLVLSLYLLLWSVNKYSGYEKGQIVALAITLSVVGTWICFIFPPRPIPAQVPLLEHVITVVPEVLHPQAKELAHRAERFHRANQWAAAHPEHSVPTGHDELRHAANALSNVITAEEWERAGGEAHLAQAFKGLDLA
jgi:hypothetical protein